MSAAERQESQRVNGESSTKDWIFNGLVIMNIGTRISIETKDMGNSMSINHQVAATGKNVKLSHDAVGLFVFND